MNPLVLKVMMQGDRAVSSGLRDMGKAGESAGRSLQSAGKAGSSAWTPYVGQLKRAEAEQKRLAEAARATADTQKIAAMKASEAARSASKEQKAAAREAAAAARIAATEAEQSARRIAKAYQDAARQATAAQRTAASAVPVMSSPMGGMGQGGGGMGGGRFGGLMAAGLGTAGLNIAENALVKAGSDAIESENLIRESFGESTGEITKWSEGLRAQLGLNALEVRKNAGVFNVMFGSMGIGSQKAVEMSKGLTMLANDMASFYNLRPEEAFEKLKSGITGESEPLKALGVLVNETTVKAYAMAHGIGTASGELTEQEKVLARYGLILQSTKKAQGDLARTMDSPANAARRLDAAMLTVQQTMGQGSAQMRANWQSAVTPILESLAQGHEGLLKFAGGTLEVGTQAANVATPLWGMVEAGLAIRDSMALATIAKNINTTATRRAAIASGVNAAASGAEAIAVTASGNAALAASGKWAILGRAKMLAMSPVGKVLGVAGAGLTLGVMGYDAIRGDKPSAGEIGSYYWNRLLGRGEEDSALNAMGHSSEDRGNAAEAQSKQIMEERALRRQTRAGALTMGAMAPESAAGSEAGAAPMGVALPVSMATASAVTNAADPFLSTIRGLEDQIRGAKGEENKNRREMLQGQLVTLRRQSSDWKRSNAEQKRRANEAERKKKEAERRAAGVEKRSDQLAGYDLDVQKARDESVFNAQIDTLETELSKAREGSETAKIKALTLQIESLKARKKYSEAMLEAAQAALTDVARATSLRKIAKINLDDDLRHAGVTSAMAGESASKSKGGKSQRLSAERIAAIMNGKSLFNGQGGPAGASLGFSPLDPSGSAGAGNRFDGLPPSLWAQQRGVIANPPLGGVSNGQSVQRAFSQGVALKPDSVRQRGNKIELTLRPLGPISLEIPQMESIERDLYNAGR